MPVHRFLIPSFLLFTLALSARGAGVFEALETTPQELSRSGVAVNVEALALLPLAADERRDLLAGWLAPGTPTGPLLASQWLEFCGQPEAALKVLDDAPESRPDPLQRTRLFFRNGRLDAATAAFAECQRELPCGPFAAYPPPKLEILLRPLVALGEWDETARFLAWLQPQCVISEWRSSVLTTRIDLALQQGSTASLFADLAKDSAVTRAIADKFLDLGAATSLSTPASGTSVADLAWCLEVDGCTPEIAPAVEAAITSDAGTPPERRELFRVLADYFRISTDRNRLLVLWMTREDEFIGHLTALGSYAIGKLPLLPLCELAARHPNNPYLNYLAGCNGNEYSPGNITAPARACLWRALKHATLVARPLDPALDPFFPPADYYRHAAATDPARFALEMLKDRTDPALLHQHLTNHPEFAQLPIIDRFRYLKAAGLEIPAWELLRQIDWSQPTNDLLGGALRFLVISGRQPSAGIWAEMFRLWPTILLGSPSKSAALIAAHSDEAFIKLGPNINEMHRDWFKRLQARGGDFNEVLRGCRWLLKDDPNAVALRDHLGISPTALPVTEAAARRELETRLNALNWFIGPGISGFPAGYARDDGNRFVGDQSGLDWVYDQPGEGKELLWLSHRFPGLRQILDASVVGYDENESLPIALRLRALLQEESPCATALDLAIYRKLIKAPADASERATRLIDRLCTHNEPDFVLFRASDGVSMRHGVRARNPVALLELGSLRDTPAVVRRAANSLLMMGQDAIPKERNDELSAVSTALAISRPPNRPASGRSVSDPATYPPKPPPTHPNQVPNAAELARARQSLADGVDDVESVELVARSLGRDGDLAELRSALGKLRQLDTGRFFGVLGEPEILERFAQPGLADIAALFALPPVDIPANHHPDLLPAYRLRFIHATLLKQDPAMAAAFRKLLIQHRWFPFLTEDLIRAGQREATVEWLAATLTEPPPEPPPLSPLRFPPLPAFVPPKPPDPYPQWDRLRDRCILDHQLATPLIAAIQASKTPSRQLTIPYLKLLENPTIETYRKVFGPIFAGQDAAAASALKKHLSDWLKSFPETQPLAAAVAAEP